MPPRPRAPRRALTTLIYAAARVWGRAERGARCYGHAAHYLRTVCCVRVYARVLMLMSLNMYRYRLTLILSVLRVTQTLLHYIYLLRHKNVQTLVAIVDTLHLHPKRKNAPSLHSPYSPA